MELQLKIVGVLLLLLSAIHAFFPGYFKWARAFAGLDLLSRQMVYVHTFFIALVVLLMGILCLTSYDELTHTLLGSRLSMGMGIFWFIRLLVQFFVYSPMLWRGKRFETIIHFIFSILWLYFSVVFLLIALK
jgi:hypothetical protein